MEYKEQYHYTHTNRGENLNIICVGAAKNVCKRLRYNDNIV